MLYLRSDHDYDEIGDLRKKFNDLADLMHDIVTPISIYRTSWLHVSGGSRPEQQGNSARRLENRVEGVAFKSDHCSRTTLFYRVFWGGKFYRKKNGLRPSID